MGEYSYRKISKISLSSSSSGMMYGSNHSVTEDLLWKDDGSIVMVKTEIRGFTKEETTWKVDPELAEKIRTHAEKADMALWDAMKYEQDPRFICTDHSSHAGGSLILDNRGNEGRPYFMFSFDQRGVIQHGKGDDLKKLEELFSECQSEENMTDHQESVTEAGKNAGQSSAFQGFPMGMGMGMLSPKQGKEDANTWTCVECGHVNETAYCTECGRKRPE